MRVTASDMLAAIKQIREIAAIRPLDDVTGAEKSELEHLETYQPKQLLVVQGDFIYQGASVARMGELESIAGEIVEVEGEDGEEDG